MMNYKSITTIFTYENYKIIQSRNVQIKHVVSQLVACMIVYALYTFKLISYLKFFYKHI